MDSTHSLPRFIQCLSALPYIPSRHIYRLADYFFKMDSQRIEEFLKEIIELRKSLVCCSRCNGWREVSGECTWCGISRNHARLCVVETWIDAYALERSNLFDGEYHILGGALDPLEGVTPDILTFNQCVKRILMTNYSEIIIATNQTPEGEATASYFMRILQQNNISDLGVAISYLASGVPVGSALEYVDRLTLGKALAHRRQVI